VDPPVYTRTAVTCFQIVIHAVVVGIILVARAESSMP
jgi:hypothetical protein